MTEYGGPGGAERHPCRVILVEPQPPTMRSVTGAKEIAAGLPRGRSVYRLVRARGPPLILRKTLAISRLFHRRLAAVAA
jgi:hypothetical protein